MIMREQFHSRAPLPYTSVLTYHVKGFRITFRVTLCQIFSLMLQLILCQVDIPRLAKYFLM